MVIIQDQIKVPVANLNWPSPGFGLVASLIAIREPSVTDGGKFREPWPNIGPSLGSPTEEREEGL